MNFKIELIFLIKPFFYMTKKSKQKFKYLENETSFLFKKHFFHHFWRAIIEAHKTIFLEGEGPTLRVKKIEYWCETG